MARPAQGEWVCGYEGERVRGCERGEGKKVRGQDDGRVFKEPSSTGVTMPRPGNDKWP